MFLDQPDDAFRVGRGQAETWAKPARDLGPRDRMVLGAALGDIVKEGRHIEGPPMRDARQDLADERMIFLEASRLDLAENADGAQQMLVDRVMVIHRELHHPHDTPKFRNESAEHTRFVHTPKRGFR